MGGPSAEAKANEAAQTAFYKNMVDEQKTAFGESQALYNDIMNVTLPVLSKGPNQYGYTPEIDALLQASIRSSADQATAKTVNATELAERQKSGGASILPTGASEQVEADVRALGEQSKASNLLQEKLSGYQRGEELYQSALNALSGQQSLLSPTSYAGAATGAGSGATSAINLADSERSNLMSTLLGGAIQGGLTLGTKAAGNLAPGVFG